MRMSRRSFIEYTALRVSSMSDEEFSSFATLTLTALGICNLDGTPVDGSGLSDTALLVPKVNREIIDMIPDPEVRELMHAICGTKPEDDGQA